MVYYPYKIQNIVLRCDFLAILMDIVTIILFLFCVHSGYRRGAARSLIDFIGALVSIVLASFMSNAASEIIYTTFVRQNLINNIRTTINGSTTLSINAQIDKYFSNIPSILSGAMENYGITSGHIKDIVSSAQGDAAANIADLLSPVIISSIKTIVFFIIFIILMIFVGIISRGISRIFRIPILKQVNGLLGGLFEALKFIAILLILMLFIQTLLPLINVPMSVEFEDAIESTVILKGIYNNNPIFGLLNF